jgi:hypothetical protein
MLDEDPRAPASMIAQRLPPLGFIGSLTILKAHLRRVRPTSPTAQVSAGCLRFRIGRRVRGGQWSRRPIPVGVA